MIMDYELRYNSLVAAIKQLQEAKPSDEDIQNWVEDNVPECNEEIQLSDTEYFGY